MRKKIKFVILVIFIFSVVGLNFVRASSAEDALKGTVDVNGITTIVVSDNDLNQLALPLINGSLKGYVKSMTVKIFDGYAEVTAITEKPITATLFIRVQAKVANNKLYPKILAMHYGFLPIPNFLINFLVGRIIGQNSENFQSNGIEVPGIEWHSVVLTKGEATVLFKDTSN